MIEIKNVGGEAYVNTENDWLRERLYEYEKIGSLTQCKKAREKEIPKQIVRAHDVKQWHCPRCDSFLAFAFPGQLKGPQPKYCSYCGQRLDWSPDNDLREEVEDDVER